MMVDAAIPSILHGQPRQLDIRRDLARVADLVELCFADTLDIEGKQYLNDMRRTAQNARLIGWASSLVEQAPMPPSGFVWEEDGRLVGNLSLIPIVVDGKRGYMIANVATHPDYRGRGIARTMTVTALRYAQEHRAAQVWLQVRDDNPSAVHIYQTNGFTERLRRTTWHSKPGLVDMPMLGEIKITKRQPGQWIMQREWLRQSYPADMNWNLPFDWYSFQPNLLGLIYRLFNMEFPRHWSVEHEGELKGVGSWKQTNGFTDPIWLAAPESMDDEAIRLLLLHIRRESMDKKPLSLNYPAGTSVDILEEAGFYPQQTLLWMRKVLFN